MPARIRRFEPDSQNRIESSRSNFTHCKRTIYSYNPIVLDHSCLIVYSCPHRASLLSHSPSTPSVPPIVRRSGRNVLIPSVPRTKEYGRQTLSRQIRTLPSRIYKRIHPLLVVSLPAPFWTSNQHHYISQIGADLEQMIGNVISRDYVKISKDRNFSMNSLLSN